MLKDTKSLGNNKAPACESRGFVHKKRRCAFWHTFIHINGDDKIDTFGDDGLDYNRFDAGWNIGLGVEFGKILVGLDTQLGFCKVMDGDAPHNANIGITLGYKF